MRTPIRDRLIQPPYTSLVDNINVHPFGPECLGKDILAVDSGLTSLTYIANLLVFVPMILSEPLLVAQFFWHNGASVAGNTDVGIYNEAGTTKLGSSGSTANSGTSVLQAVNVTDFYLPAHKRLWLAIGCDSGTQTFFAANLIVNLADYVGFKQQASGWSSGLPSSISLDTPTQAVLPNFGFTGRAVI